MSHHFPSLKRALVLAGSGVLRCFVDHDQSLCVEFPLDEKAGTDNFQNDAFGMSRIMADITGLVFGVVKGGVQIQNKFHIQSLEH